MPQRQHLGVSGLYTDPNPHVAVPEGALAEASECVLRRVGVLEPRPGFKSGTAIASLTQLNALIAYQSAVLAVGLDTVTKTYLSTSHTVLTEGAAQLSWALDYIRGQESRGNLYLTTTDTPRKISAVGANQVAYGIGAIPPTVVSAAATVSPGTGVVGDDQSVSYRAVIKRQDASGVVTYSAPSGRVIASNTSGGARDVTLTVAWRNTIAWTPSTRTGDKFQLYRSLVVDVATTPDDEHFLVYEFPLSNTGGTSTFTDAAAETRLGAPLYTNDDEEGPEAANWRPPASKDLALYQGSLFFANQTDYARAQFARFVETNALSGNVNGVGTRAATATLTHNSTTISALSPTELAGLEVGMLIALPAADMGDFTNHPTPITITAINTGAGTVTASSQWTGATASHTVFFFDALRLEVPSGSGTIYTYNAVVSGPLIDAINRGATDAFSGAVYAAAPGLFAVGIGVAESYTNSSVTVGFREIVIEALATTTNFEIQATHGSDYNPALVNVSTVDKRSAESHPNRIGWSKTDQPDHFLLSSFQDVGNSAPILRALSTRDAVWILKGKGDGVYRLSGFGATAGFRVDPFDSSTYLLHANLAVVLEDRVYAWTNVGLVSISDSGVVPLSAPRIASETRALETLLDHAATTPGAWAVANSKAGEVIFGLPPTPLTTDGGSAINYCYNTRTAGLTSWFQSDDQTLWLEDGAVSCGAYNLATRALWFGQTDTGTPRVERLESDAIVAADESYVDLPLGIPAIVSGQLVALYVTDFGDWVAEIGDLVALDDGSAGVVIGFIEGPPFDFVIARCVAETFAGGGTLTAYKAFTSRVTWRPKTADIPSAMKRYQSAITHWQSVHGLAQWDVDFDVIGAGAQGTAETNEYTREGYTRDDLIVDHRALVPRGKSYGSQLIPSLEITQADARWQVSGLSLDFEPVSSRVSR